VAKRSLTIAGHRTSASLEEPFWTALREIADADGESLAGLMARIDRERPRALNLSAAARIHALEWYRRKASAPLD
jgi:predicted DNA-binding ribbon-helix-helix protein